MRKFAVTRKALRVYAAYNPKYFPLMFLQAIFNNLAPYFNLWMSAEIVTSLYEARGKEEIYRMVLITLFGNLIIRVLIQPFNSTGMFISCGSNNPNNHSSI